MGYKVQRTIFRLKFADPKYAGLEVAVRSPSMDVFLDVAGMVDLDVNKVSKEDVEQINKLFGHFADSVLDWNLEDEDTGDPIPHTVEGVRSLDLDFTLDMIQAWVGAVQGTRRDLPQPSSDGQQSLEASLPMEPWSQSLPSLPEPVSS